MFPKLAKVTRDRAEANITVEGKNYIYVTIQRGTGNVYWQLADQTFSLIELGFDLPSGRLIKCAVPLFNGEVDDRSAEDLTNPEPGTPFFDLAPWPIKYNQKGWPEQGSYLEQPGRIKLLKKSGGLSIIWGDGPPARSLLYANRIICDFNEADELMALSLVGQFAL